MWPFSTQVWQGFLCDWYMIAKKIYAYNSMNYLSLLHISWENWFLLPSEYKLIVWDCNCLLFNNSTVDQSWHWIKHTFYFPTFFCLIIFENKAEKWFIFWTLMFSKTEFDYCSSCVHCITSICFSFCETTSKECIPNVENFIRV